MFNSLNKDSYPYSLNSWATRESFYFTLWTNKSSCPNSPKESPQGWAGVSQVCIQFCHAFFVGGLHGFQIQRSKGHPRLPDLWPCRHRLALGSNIQNSDHISYHCWMREILQQNTNRIKGRLISDLFLGTSHQAWTEVGFIHASVRSCSDA